MSDPPEALPTLLQIKRTHPNSWPTSATSSTSYAGPNPDEPDRHPHRPHIAECWTDASTKAPPDRNNNDADRQLFRVTRYPSRWRSSMKCRTRVGINITGATD